MPHTIPGCLHPSNARDSVDWDEKGLFAYSSHNVIFIVDVMKMQRIQALDMHTAAINIVRWSPASSSISSEDKKIASSDISGQIIVTNPFSAAKLNQFQHSNSAVQQMFWYPWKDISRDFLLVLHSQSTLILWNVQTAEKIWSHTFSHVPLYDFCLDPFCAKNLIFSSSGNKVLVSCDVSLSEPLSSGHLFQVVSENATTNSTNIHILKYHKAYRNTVFVGIQSTIYLINPELMCCLSKVAIESNLLDILPCSRRDALFGIHSNAAITLRIGTYEDSEKSSFGLEKICQTECIRHGSSQRIISASLCPTTQSSICVVYQNGKLGFWQLKNEKTELEYRKCYIEDFLEFGKDLETKKIGDLSIYQLAKIGSLNSGVTCVRMRPMDELTKVENDPFANTSLGSLHLASVGTNSGTVHLIDVFTSQIYRDISVQASPIKCLEWGGVYSLVTAGFNHSLSASQIVRNELYITDIRTGLARRIRPEVDESPISIVRVSYYHCYLALAFQREPLEIWDLKGLRLLRRMSRSCPLIVDMAWSNKHHSIKTTESTQQSVYRENLVLLDAENRIYHITLRGLHVRDGKMVNTQWKSASAQICAMAWKDDMLAVGDVEGSLVVWDLGKRQSRQVRDVSHSRVLRMLFSRLAGDHTMAVLHSREVTLWDTEAMSRIQTIRTDSAPRLFLDADLCGLSPLVLSNDNQLRFVVSNSKNMAIPDKELPALCQSEPSIENVLEMCQVQGDPMRKERTLRRFRGDHFAADLLDICIDRIFESDDGMLAPNLQMFWRNQDFKTRECRVISIASKSEQAIDRRLVEQGVVVGGVAKDRVIDRLIVSPDLRYSSIKAALLVSSQNDEKSKSLIKLIATNLIASDLIEDGVELLFLVGAGSDACKYLQSQKMWTKSIVYAKMGLEDPSEVETKWIQHLAEESKHARILADAARSNFPDVVESTSQFDSQLARLILRTSTTTTTPSSTPSP